MTNVWIVSEKNDSYDGPEISMRVFSTEELARKFMEDNATYLWRNGITMRKWWDLDSLSVDSEDWLTKYA